MNITSRDFVPPIITRVIEKIRNPQTNKYPFNAIPFSFNPRLIVDVGANIGDVALAALKSFPQAHIICFEPVKNTYIKLLDRLTSLKGRVTFYNKALSDREGEAEINITNFHGANSIEKLTQFHKIFNPSIREMRKEKIELVMLDNVFSTFPEELIDILKIDVEGHELQVLNGGENTIKNNVDTIFIEAALQRDASWEEQHFLNIFNVLENWGFRLVNIYDVCSETNGMKETDMLITQFDCVFRHKRYLK